MDISSIIGTVHRLKRGVNGDHVQIKIRVFTNGINGSHGASAVKLVVQEADLEKEIVSKKET